MSSSKNYLIALLALTTVGGALLAWRQHREIEDLRSAAVNKEERADLQKRLWDLEKRNRELQAQHAGPREPGPDGEARGNPDGSDRGPGGRGGRGDPRRDGGAAFTAIRDLMAKPEVQAMVSQQQAAAIDSQYAKLFKNLNLQPEQIDRLKSLLAERTTTLMDVMSAARDQGIDPRQNPDAFRKLMADAQTDINNSIKGVIGEAGFEQLTNYEQTMPQRAVVGQLEARLSYTNTPLTSTQSEQLVQILAQNTATTTNTNTPSGDGPGRGPGGPGRGPDMGGMLMGAFGPGGGPVAGAIDIGRGAATVTPAAVAQAQTVLSAPQTQALQQIQQQQQSQQQLRKMVDETMRASQPPPPPSGSGSTGSQNPPRKR